MKKGQGLPLNVIIIAALALLVLVVLTIVFLGKTGTTVQQIGACESKGGLCAPQCGVGDAADYSTQYADWKCNQDDVDAGNDKCCIKIGI